MAMSEADAQRAVGDDLGEGEVGRLDIEVALDDLQVGSDAAQEVVGILVGKVTET